MFQENKIKSSGSNPIKEKIWYLGAAFWFVWNATNNQDHQISVFYACIMCFCICGSHIPYLTMSLSVWFHPYLLASDLIKIIGSITQSRLKIMQWVGTFAKKYLF